MSIRLEQSKQGLSGRKWIERCHMSLRLCFSSAISKLTSCSSLFFFLVYHWFFIGYSGRWYYFTSIIVTDFKSINHLTWYPKLMCLSFQHSYASPPNTYTAYIFYSENLKHPQRVSFKVFIYVHPFLFFTSVLKEEKKQKKEEMDKN